MKNHIINALKNAKNETMFNTSVIFVNNLTDKVRFHNGITEEFEPITKDVFNALLSEKIIEREKCICQGETRYIYNANL